MTTITSMSMPERAIPMTRSSILATFAAATLACASHTRSMDANTEPTDGDAVVAIWRMHQVEFVYHSASVYYACDALQEKIGDILRAVGAHQRIAVEVACGAGDLVNFTVARVTLAMPVEATPAAVQAATTFSSREQLIARVRNLHPPTPADIERFPAQWRAVTLSHGGGLRLQSGDCELLSALRRQVFPLLSIRIAERPRRCSPKATVRPRLEVIALMPTPREAKAGDGSAG
jgi:hypothetical protein